jgi:hypothetical protein
MFEKNIVYITAHPTSTTKVEVGSGKEVTFISVGDGFGSVESLGIIATLIIERRAIAFLDIRWWQSINTHADKIVIV